MSVSGSPVESDVRQMTANVVRSYAERITGFQTARTSTIITVPAIIISDATAAPVKNRLAQSSV